jgi:glycine cleavage system H lipoate-binding protein
MIEVSKTKNTIAMITKKIKINNETETKITEIIDKDKDRDKKLGITETIEKELRKIIETKILKTIEIDKKIEIMKRTEDIKIIKDIKSLIAIKIKLTDLIAKVNRKENPILNKLEINLKNSNNKKVYNRK